MENTVFVPMGPYLRGLREGGAKGSGGLAHPVITGGPVALHFRGTRRQPCKQSKLHNPSEADS